MEIIDGVFAALIISIILYIINSDSDGGRRGRLPSQIT